jgi:hypothetical protein
MHVNRVFHNHHTTKINRVTTRPFNILSVVLIACATAFAQSSRPTINLAGPWKFRIDSTDVGVKERWFMANLPEFPGQGTALVGVLDPFWQEKGYVTLKEYSRLCNSNVPPGFSSIFWNTAWTSQQPPHTLGILCDPRHPALKYFPLEKRPVARQFLYSLEQYVSSKAFAPKQSMDITALRGLFK